MEKILLLTEHEEDRAVLSQYLSAGYHIIAPDSAAAALDATFDLGIVDLPGLERFGNQMRALKHRSFTWFPPVLLVIPQENLSAAHQDGWPEVDDVIASPIAKAELRLRVEALLRMRRVSTENGLHRQMLRQSRAALESISDGIITIDLEGRLSYCNKTFTDFCGYTFDELSASDLAKVLFFEPEIERAITAAVREGQPWQREVVLRTKDGRPTFISLRVTRLEDDAGRVLGVVAACTDLSERKRLHETHAYLAAIVENTEDAVIGKTLEGTVLSWNPGAERIYGYSADEVIGRSVRLLFPPGYEEEFTEIHEKLQRGEVISRRETRRVRKDGREIDISLTLSPIRGPAGDIIGVSTIERDITQRKFAERRLRESEERFRQLAESISEVFWLQDAETNQSLYVSPAYETIYGRSIQSFYEDPHSYIDAVHPDDRERVITAMQAQPAVPFDEEYRVIRPDGDERYVHARTFPVIDEVGNVIRIAGIAQDITRGKLAETSEHEQRVLAEALRDTAIALTGTLDLTEVLERILYNVRRVVPHDAVNIMLVENDVARVILSEGYDPSPAFKEAWDALRLPVAAVPDLRQMADSGQTIISPDRWIDAERQSEWHRLLKSMGLFSYVGAPIRLEGEILGFINLDSKTPDFFTPVHADRLQAFAEQACIGIHNARLFEQGQAIAALEERQRLARDLHDAVSQTLFSASLISEALPRQYRRDPDQTLKLLEQLQQLNRSALAEMRALIFGLRPTALPEVELGDAIQQLVETVQSRHRTAIKFLAQGEYHDLSDEVKVALYRIAQEAVNNVIKHAQATQAEVILQRPQGQVELRVTDNGRGFDPGQVSSSRLGLGIIRERAECIGASLSVTSEPGGGTQIVIIWPVTHGVEQQWTRPDVSAL